MRSRSPLALFLLVALLVGGCVTRAGAMAGSSAVILKVRITEKETGKVIAEPHFYARAAAYSGAFSIGAADNAMLIRIATRVTDYLQANFSEAVGGRTGAEPAK